jgi:hypothetical protein
MSEDVDLWDAHGGLPCDTCGLHLVDVYEEVVLTREVVLDDRPVARFVAEGEPPPSVPWHYELIPPRTVRRWLRQERAPSHPL